MRAPSTEPHDQNPFPGLRPFTEDEEHLFFGRENQVDAMVDKLAVTHFLAVVGTSGSGKSSLVNCGLRPALSRGLMARAGTSWRIAQFRPGNDPIGAMAGALAQNGVLFRDYVAEGLPLCDIIETTLRMSRLGLIDIFEQAKLGEGVNLLVVADQFEELFRYQQLGTAGAERDKAEQMTAFVNLLLEVRERAPERIFVVLTMRSDFLGDCTHFPGLPEAINAGQYLVPRLTRDERRAAIEGPIQVAGAEISPVLLTTLVNDVGDNPDQLSILQHALNRTWAYWKRMDGKTPLDLDDYKAIGTMEHALDEHAKRAYGELTGARQQQICEKMFKALTDKTDPRGVRRPTTIATLCALTDATAAEITDVANVFRKPSRSFLMPPMPGEPDKELDKGAVIDISHESLMRVWKQLNMWADEEARSAGVYRRLAETAAEFSDDEEGLYRGPQLQIALAWRERDKPNETWAARYHPGFAQAMAFLDKSRAKRDADLDKEKRRSERELRMARVAAIVMGSFFLLAAAAGGAAYWAFLDSKASRTRAQHEERLANLAKSEAQRNQQQAERAQKEARYKQELAERSKARLFAEVTRNDPADLSKKILLALESLPDQTSSDPQARNRPLVVSMQGVLQEGIDDLREIKILTGHSGAINAVAVTPDGKRIVTGSDDPSVRVWEMETGKQVLQFKAHEGAVKTVALTRDRIVTGGDDHVVRVWSAATGERLLEIQAAPEGSVISLAVTPDEKYVVAGTDRGIARVWALDTGELKLDLKGLNRSVVGVAFTPDGDVVTASADGTVRIWGATTGEQLHRFEVGRWAILGMTLIPDGSKIVILLSNHSVQTLNANTGQMMAQINTINSTALSIAPMPRSSRVVIGWGDGMARILEGGIQFEHQEFQMKGHEGAIRAVAVSPDGERIITGSADTTVRIWIKKGRASTPPPPVDDSALKAAWSNALVESGKQAVARCLSPKQRKELALAPRPPAWCIDQEKYPFHTQLWKDWKAGKPVEDNDIVLEYADFADKALKEIGDIDAAMDAAKISIDFGKSIVWTRVNLAHAEMLADQTDLARTEYLTHCGTWLAELSKVWETAVIEDFRDMRTNNIYKPLMDEVEKSFKENRCLPNVDKARAENAR